MAFRSDMSFLLELEKLVAAARVDELLPSGI
ncbi:hypothetical protein STAFG_3329 [Streptomyces afghaniensis 772]|uniref:Uncharacterized protein n=1 Tax=Streptomyces afghaniensis 772 TaxID=1283301 RepID=S4MSH5_9ACTN|nr:hypothetical protein STAFG_3329 [Streptomyces afghaniensis 772]